LSSNPAGSLLTYLSQVPDPRGLQGRRHQLVAMLATVVCAVLCGARGYAAIAQWLHKWPLDFCHRLGYLRRPPKKGAFRNLLLALDAERFERAIADWMSQTLNVTLTEDDLQGVSIDGKWLRGTRDARDRMVVLLAAFDHRTGGVFAQHRVPEGTNEAKAVLDLLEQLMLPGRVITADAAFCQQEVCETIVHRQGHYVLAVKDNQPALKQAISSEFTAQDAAFSPGSPA